MRRMKLYKLIIILSITAAAAIMFGNLLNFGINSSDYFAANKDDVLLSAEQGEAIAQYNLAVMYSKGVGYPKSDSEALKWYAKAAEQGHAQAQYNMGMLYYFGKNVPQDSETAYKWVMVSAEIGENPVAKEALVKIAEEMPLEQVAKAKTAARAWAEQHKK